MRILPIHRGFSRRVGRIFQAQRWGIGNTGLRSSSPEQTALERGLKAGSSEAVNRGEEGMLWKSFRFALMAGAAIAIGALSVHAQTDSKPMDKEKLDKSPTEV